MSVGTCVFILSALTYSLAFYLFNVMFYVQSFLEDDALTLDAVFLMQSSDLDELALKFGLSDLERKLLYRALDHLSTFYGELQWQELRILLMVTHFTPTDLNSEPCQHWESFFSFYSIVNFPCKCDNGLRHLHFHKFIPQLGLQNDAVSCS